MSSPKKLKKEDKISASNLPDDLIFTCILPLLSFKCLSKFKSVNRTWHRTISYDTKFACDQSLSPSPLSCGAVFHNCYSNNKIEFLDIYGSPIGINPRNHLFTNKTVRCRKILASAGGLLCLLLELNKINNPAASICLYYVSNLTTEAGDFIDTIDWQYNVGLAFDPVIDPNRYKLVHPFVEYREGIVKFTFAIYSSDKREWANSSKEIDVVCTRYSRWEVNAVTLKNIVYWDCHEFAVSFDPWKVKASCMLLPVHGTSEFEQELGTCNGIITCTRMDKKKIEVYAFEKRWERMYTVVLDSVINANHCVFKEFWHMMKTRLGRSFESLGRAYNVFPFPYEGGGRLFFRMHSRKTKFVLSYDLKSEKVEKICESRVKGRDEMDMKGEDQRVLMYHNSMVRMPALQTLSMRVSTIRHKKLNDHLDSSRIASA